VPPASSVNAQVEKGISALQAWARRVPDALAQWWVASGVGEPAGGGEATDLPPEENGPRPVPASLLERIAPAPDWSAAVAALDAALKPWMAEPSGVPALVLAPCYQGAPSIVRRWGEAHGWAIVDPPPRDAIPQPHAVADWLAAREQRDMPWVLPQVERCYLRTPRGLAFMRQLLDQWADGALGQGLIGCDPHAWAYLQRVWPGQLAHRLTLQPFPPDALARWLRALAASHRPNGQAPVSFRKAGADDLVLPEHSAAADGSTAPPNDEPTRAYLRGLAVYSQGYPGVAWTLWRRSLLLPPDEPSPEADEPSGEASEAEQTIWVRPWSEVERPQRPSDFAQPDAFVLHALLLHGGLSAGQLSPLLPTDQYALRQRLHRLRAAGFVVKEAATWQLTPAGYPAACDMLRREAYLPDPYAP